MSIRIETPNGALAFYSLEDAFGHARDINEGIRTFKRETILRYQQLGQVLLQLRPRFPHGLWRRELEKHGLHYKTAERAIRIYKACLARTKSEQSDYGASQRVQASVAVAESLDRGGCTLMELLGGAGPKERDAGDSDEFEPLPHDGDDLEDQWSSGEQLSLVSVFERAEASIAQAREASRGADAGMLRRVAEATERYRSEVRAIVEGAS